MLGMKREVDGWDIFCNHFFSEMDKFESDESCSICKDDVEEMLKPSLEKDTSKKDNFAIMGPTSAISSIDNCYFLVP